MIVVTFTGSYQHHKLDTISSGGEKKVPFHYIADLFVSFGSPYRGGRLGDFLARKDTKIFNSHSFFCLHC